MKHILSENIKKESILRLYFIKMLVGFDGMLMI